LPAINNQRLDLTRRFATALREVSNLCGDYCKASSSFTCPRGLRQAISFLYVIDVQLKSGRQFFNYRGCLLKVIGLGIGINRQLLVTRDQCRRDRSQA
jgi:hypothetical protein